MPIYLYTYAVYAHIMCVCLSCHDLSCLVLYHHSPTRDCENRNHSTPGHSKYTHRNSFFRARVLYTCELVCAFGNIQTLWAKKENKLIKLKMKQETAVNGEKQGKEMNSRNESTRKRENREWAESVTCAWESETNTYLLTDGLRQTKSCN